MTAPVSRGPTSVLSDGSGSVLARQLLRAVSEAPADELPALVGALAQAQAAALARLTAPHPEHREMNTPDANIPTDEAARRLGVSPSYIYKNARTLPFTVR